MGRGHGHGHGHGMAATRAGVRHLPRLRIALILTATFLVVEVAAALATGSLALLSDAGHMLTDVAGLGMALAAISVANRLQRPNGHTFGLYRLEILAALVNAVLLTGVGAYVLWEAIDRLANPVAVPSIPLLVVAGIGLIVNLAAFALLRGGADESLNVRGAYLEVVADMVTSLGVLVGGFLMMATGWSWIDPVIGTAVGLLVVPRAIRLGLQALRVLVQAAPSHVDVELLRADLATIPGVREVRDLHVWTLTSEMEVGSVHLTVERGSDHHAVLDQAQQLLRQDYAVAHPTVQIEPADHRDCPEAEW